MFIHTNGQPQSMYNPNMVQILCLVLPWALYGKRIQIDQDLILKSFKQNIFKGHLVHRAST